jgi:hypothetical protein
VVGGRASCPATDASWRVRGGAPDVVCHTDDVAAVNVRVRRVRCASASALALLLLVALLVPVVTFVGLSTSAGAASSPQMSTPSTTSPKSSSPLRAPKTSNAQDTTYFTDVAEADPALASYEQKQENVALRALLTDGSAFCALLQRARNLNDALVEEASGARSTEAQTHLPLSVTTFNTIESVSLLTLCPSEQKLLPTSVRSKVRALKKAFAKPPG